MRRWKIWKWKKWKKKKSSKIMYFSACIIGCIINFNYWFKLGALLVQHTPSHATLLHRARITRTRTHSFHRKSHIFRCIRTRTPRHIRQPASQPYSQVAHVISVFFASRCAIVVQFLCIAHETFTLLIVFSFPYRTYRKTYRQPWPTFTPRMQWLRDQSHRCDRRWFEIKSKISINK